MIRHFTSFLLKAVEFVSWNIPSPRTTPQGESFIYAVQMGAMDFKNL